MAIEHLHAMRPFGTRPQSIFIVHQMAAVAVAKLLLCCDIMQRGESVTRWEASSVASFKPEC